jgi:hypothetical protein
LVLWRVVGLAFPSKKYNVLEHLLLRDGRSVVPAFVGFFLAFAAVHGVEADWVFLRHLN